MGLKKDINESGFNNLLKGWFTTIFIGIPLILFAFLLPLDYKELSFTYSPEWYVRGAMIVIGILACLAPNKLPSIILELLELLKKKFLLVLIPIALVAIFATSQSCSNFRHSSTTTTTEVSYEDSTIIIPGETVGISITDSILNELKKLKAEGKTPEIIYRNSPDSKTYLTLKMDDKGQLQADCTSEEELLKILNKIINTKQETEKTQKIIPEWVVVVGITGLVLLLISLALNFIKFIK